MKLAILCLAAAAGLSAQRVVLVSGDEEYRSEESLPALARILERNHGMQTTVLFAIDRNDGTVNPNQNDNIPGLEALRRADLMILLVRWRDLPDDQMKHIFDYIESGKPVIGLRTATHAFDLKSSKTYQRWTWNSKEWDGGFGRQVLGETWIAHHGKHGKQSTRGVIPPEMKNHQILRGVRDIWGPTDVYEVRLPLPGDSKPLVLGQVVEGMRPDDPPAAGKVNDPMLPVAWVKTYRGARVFTTTMGASQDFANEGFRRMIVNAVYWALGKDVPAKANVDFVGKFEPTPFGFGGFKKNLKPADF